MRVLFLVLGFLLFSGTTQAQEVFRFGYDNCDLLVMTEPFELSAGQTYEINVHKGGCLLRDLGWTEYGGFTFRGWKATDVTDKDGLRFEVEGLSGPLPITIPDEAKGYTLRVTNTNNGKRVVFRVNVQSGQTQAETEKDAVETIWPSKDIR